MLTPPTTDLFKVERISLRGPGVMILTGPSSCGKGEVAAALRGALHVLAGVAASAASPALNVTCWKSFKHVRTF